MTRTRRLGAGRLGAAVAGSVALALVAGCTTVEPHGTLVAGDARTGSSAPGAARSSIGPAGSVVAGGPGAPAGSTAPAAAGAGETGAGAFAGAVAGAADAASCPLGGPVRIGVSYSSDLSAGLAAVGQPEAAQAALDYAETTEATYRAIADGVNAAGGVAGCPIELVFFDFSSLAADGFDGQSQRECAYFAEDQRVFAVFSAALETDVLVECLSQRGVVSFFNGAEYAPNQRDFDRYQGFLYQPWAINADRWASFVDAWNDAGFFGSGARVGILIAEDGTGNGQRLAYDVWQPRLEELGIEVVSTFEYNWIRSYATVSDASTAMSAAVLKFKADGVTHLLPTPDGSAMSFFFTPQAESQDFRPAYGTTTFSGGPPFLSPEGQTENWMTVGWDVLSFVASATTPPPTDGNPPNDATARCDAAAATVATGINVARRWCDTVNFLQLALQGAGEITPEALRAGAEALGPAQQLASGFGGSFTGPGRYDSANQARVARWDGGADQYRYASPVIDIP